MSSLNKAQLIGHLGNDPDTRYLPDGTAVTTVSLATSEKWKDKNGEKQERTEWHRIKFFKKGAEIAGEYLRKGMRIYIEGRLHTQKWTDKNNIDRYTTEIISTGMIMLDRKSDTSPSQPANNQAQHNYDNGFDDMDDDIPF